MRSEVCVTGVCGECVTEEYVGCLLQRNASLRGQGGVCVIEQDEDMKL